MMTIFEILKWDGQCPKSIQTLVMSMNLQMQSSSLIMDLIWLHISLFRLGVDELLHFLIASMSSNLENRFHSVVGLSGMLPRKWKSTSYSWAELKKLWSTFQRSSSSIYGHSSYWIVSTIGSLHFLTQFISFHGPYFLFAILSILSSKKECLDFLTMFLKFFQFSRLWDCWYLCNVWWQSSFHHSLECFVILTVFECLNHKSSILVANCWTISSSDTMF